MPADNAPVNELFSLISTPIVIAMSEINTWLFSSNFRGLFLVLSKCFQRRDVNKIFEGIPQRAEKRRDSITTLRNSSDSVDFTTAIIVFGTQS